MMPSNGSHMLREVGSAPAAVVPKVIDQLVVDSTVAECAEIIVIRYIIILLDEIVCLIPWKCFSKPTEFYAPLMGASGNTCQLFNDGDFSGHRVKAGCHVSILMPALGEASPWKKTIFSHLDNRIGTNKNQPDLGKYFPPTTTL